MASQTHFIFILLALASVLATSNGVKPRPLSVPFNRTAFPADFIFGAGMASYQSEGAANIDGRGPSIWDTFTRKHPEKTGNATGDIADDFYHRYKEDIILMKKIGLNSFRFSISWSRVLPQGKISGGVNPLGVKFYNSLINELLANGLKPFVTLFHWDLPQALEDEYGGFLSSKIVSDFHDYVDFCFKTFGDRVKDWVTINEPYSVSTYGYATGTFAPGRCSNYIGTCTAGNSGTEPYIVAHHLLLCHAAGVKLYKEKYQAHQKGQIGITLPSHWIMPLNKTDANQRAALRALDFIFGWYAHPVTYGDYPETMKAIVGSRLPKFTAEQSNMLKGSLDFLGVNYYTTYYAENNPLTSSVNLSSTTDYHCTLSPTKNGVNLGIPTDLNWLYIYPKGIRELLLYIKAKYNNPIIYINENGLANLNNDSLPIKEALKDAQRIQFYSGHLKYLALSIKEGVKLKGYYAWSFFDDFEWDVGYEYRFGIIYVDFKNGLKRHLKYSAYWFKNFLLN